MSLAVHDLCVRYRRHAALKGISFQAKAGEVTAIVGPNGSGKSSLIRALAGLLPHEGRVVSASGSAGRIGYMPQDIGSCTALTVLEVVLLGRLGSLQLNLRAAEIDAAAAALETMNIAHLAERDLGELSGGQRQLVFLAQVLARAPTILLLDEPISALDLRHQVDVLETVQRLTRERALTTLIVVHDLSAAARVADRVVLLHAGNLAGEGRPEDVLTPALLHHVFGIEALVTRLDGVGLVVLPRRPASDIVAAGARLLTP